MPGRPDADRFLAAIRRPIDELDLVDPASDERGRLAPREGFTVLVARRIVIDLCDRATVGATRRAARAVSFRRLVIPSA